MSLELAVQENTAAIRDLIAAIANGLPTSAAQVAAVVKETKVTETKVADKPKAETKVKEVPKPEAEAAAATPEQKDDGAVVIELQQVIDVTLALGKAGKREALVALLGEFGAAKSSLLDPSDFAGFHAKATELLAA